MVRILSMRRLRWPIRLDDPNYLLNGTHMTEVRDELRQAIERRLNLGWPRGTAYFHYWDGALFRKATVFWVLSSLGSVVSPGELMRELALPSGEVDHWTLVAHVHEV